MEEGERGNTQVVGHRQSLEHMCVSIHPLPAPLKPQEESTSPRLAPLRTGEGRTVSRSERHAWLKGSQAERVYRQAPAPRAEHRCEVCVAFPGKAWAGRRRRAGEGGGQRVAWKTAAPSHRPRGHSASARRGPGSRRARAPAKPGFHVG